MPRTAASVGRDTVQHWMVPCNLLISKRFGEPGRNRTFNQHIKSAVISGSRDDLRLGDECNREVQHLSLRDTDLLTGKLLDILVRTP